MIYDFFIQDIKIFRCFIMTFVQDRLMTTLFEGLKVKIRSDITASLCFLCNKFLKSFLFNVF